MPFFGRRGLAIVVLCVVSAVQCTESRRGVALPPFDGSAWEENMYPVIGSESNGRGVGEMVRFPHNEVVVEGHGVLAKDVSMMMNQSAVQYESFDVTPYSYVEARGEWRPLGETLNRKLMPRNSPMFDTTVCFDMEVKSIDIRHHFVAFLDDSVKYDTETDDFVRMQRTVSLYGLRYGTWEELGILVGSVMENDVVSTFWGADFALSAKGKTIAVSVMDGKDAGKIHLYHFDLDTNKWDPFEELESPLVGSSVGFGYRVQMNEVGDTVAGLGCDGGDTENDDENPSCYFEAFQKTSRLSHSRGNLWSSMGQKVDCSDMKLRPSDRFLMDANGTSIVLGFVDVDQHCPISKQGGKIRVYEYDEGKQRWVPKGQDLDSLMDLSTAEQYSIQPTSIGSHGALVTLYAFWVDKQLGAQSLVFTCKFADGRWALVGHPVHVGDFGEASLSPDGEQLAVGAQFDVHFLGSLRLFNMYQDDTELGHPAKPRREPAVSRYAKALGSRRRNDVPVTGLRASR